MTCFGLSVSKMIYFRVISGKMTCFWVISVEDDLFLGYQRRRWPAFSCRTIGHRSDVKTKWIELRNELRIPVQQMQGIGETLPGIEMHVSVQKAEQSLLALAAITPRRIQNIGYKQIARL